MIQPCKDLQVLRLSYELAMEVFRLTKTFPKDELYSLTDQMRRSSRSVTANIVESWSKRRYENVFRRHLLDAIGSSDETKVWLSFAADCNYITNNARRTLTSRCDDLGKMLQRLLENWKTYTMEKQS